MYARGYCNANDRNAVNQARISSLGQNIEDRLERWDKTTGGQESGGDLVEPGRKQL
jgi:hypothetical protein